MKRPGPRAVTLAISAVALTGLAVSTLPIAPRFLWNASASVPPGLYILRPANRPQVGDLLAVQPPSALARFIAERGYTTPDLPLLKRVAAVAGQRICRHGLRITVDADVVGDALLHDRFGRPMPRWQGCITLAEGTVFLMNRGVPDSLDGRYFGPLPLDTVLGRAVPLWLRSPTPASHPSPSHRLQAGDTR